MHRGSTPILAAIIPSAPIANAAPQVMPDIPPAFAKIGLKAGMGYPAARLVTAGPAGPLVRVFANPDAP